MNPAGFLALDADVSRHLSRPDIDHLWLGGKAVAVAKKPAASTTPQVTLCMVRVLRAHTGTIGSRLRSDTGIDF